MDKRMQHLARLAITRGVALKPGQPLYIKTDIIGAELAREAARQAYACGASQVEIEYQDNVMTRMNLEMDSLESLEKVSEWKLQRYGYFTQQGAARLTIFAPDPVLLQGVEAERISTQRRAFFAAMKPFTEVSRKKRLQWSMIAVPTPEWAKLVFPDLREQAAVDALWDAIYHCSYIDEEGKAEERWAEHTARLLAHCEFLNQLGLRRLHFTNSLGTNLEMELCDGARFMAAVFKDFDGDPYIPNIPTEEVASAPKRTSVNGVVKASRPMSYAGALIEDFTFTFKDGLVVDFSAEKGCDVLKGLLDTDEGSRMLGEVAFVPHNSPISQTGLLFYNTLFDENASCHLAFGAGYPDVIDGGNMSVEERIAKGLNDSTVHVDFMFGTADLDCTATNSEGEYVQIFKNGDFAF